MMYANRAAIAVKVNGRVLREYKDTVLIPFGSEYSILIKNLNTKRGVFHVFLDGDDVVPNGLVLNAGQEVDLERWIKNGNLSEGNRFKFIERTGDIEEHRGIKMEDGLIRVEYQFEKELPKPVYRTPHYGLNTGNYWDHNNVLRSYNGISADASAQIPKGMSVSSMNATMNCVASSAVGDMVVGSAQATFTNDVGITVPGSKSEQKFKTVSSFPMETEKHNMILKLLGETPENKPVVAPVTVKAKPRCVTCGTTNKATAHFCSKCGTALEIFA